MNTTTTDATATRTTVASDHAESTPLRRLRAVLLTNAATSFVGGAVGLVAASSLSDELGFDHVALTRIISIGLMVFALDVALLARGPAARAVPWSAYVSVADLTWVAGTVVLIASGTLTTAGVVVAAVLGVGVLDFGVLQLWLRGRART